MSGTEESVDERGWLGKVQQLPVVVASWVAVLQTGLPSDQVGTELGVFDGSELRRELGCNRAG